MTQPTAEERFWANVDKGTSGDCWSWTGADNGSGYGRLWVNGVRIYAHRYAYELLVAPISDGLHIDHLCRNRRCVNPDHLEPVTRKENILRGVSPPAERARATHCIRGHKFDGQRANRNERVCRICDRERHREAYRQAAGGEVRSYTRAYA